MTLCLFYLYLLLDPLPLVLSCRDRSQIGASRNPAGPQADTDGPHPDRPDAPGVHWSARVSGVRTHTAGKRGHAEAARPASKIALTFFLRRL